jgi:hypothetical protein
LSLAQDLGWVNNDQHAQQLKDDYQKVLAYQQSADDSQDVRSELLLCVVGFVSLHCYFLFVV